MKKVTDKYVETLDLLMIKKSDEMRQKSDKFFEFFVNFFNEVHKSMPKIEEEKKENPKAALRKAQAAMAAAIRLQKLQDAKKKEESGPKGGLGSIQLKPKAEQPPEKEENKMKGDFKPKPKKGNPFGVALKKKEDVK